MIEIILSAMYLSGVAVSASLMKIYCMMTPKVHDSTIYERHHVYGSPLDTIPE